VPLPGRKPLLVLAAMNPGMMRLAGEHADGVLLNYQPAELVAAAITHVRGGETGAGRAPGSCRIYAYVHCAVTPRTPEALDETRQEVVSYAMAAPYARALDRAGFAAELEAMREAFARRDRAAATAAISDRMLDAVEHIGSPGDVRAYVSSYIAAGVEEVVVGPLGRGQDVQAVISETIEALAGLGS
jgi:alkanesulfonate monooxygenase SsuD/methylene tetrahydromethanopterin reductase-like flavin-dependent oxidoreductase (luciferase family)